MIPTRRAACLVLLLLTLLAGSGCAKAPPRPLPPATPTVALGLDEESITTRPTRAATPDSASAVATVNGQAIPRAQWAAQVARVRHVLETQAGVDAASSAGQARLERVADEVLDELITEALIRQAAQAQGITIPSSQLDEVVAREIELAGGADAFEAWLSETGMDLGDYRTATELQLLASALRERVTSELPATQPQAHLRHILLPTEEEAAAVLAELAGGADFAALAASRSVDPGSREVGGDLGWLPRGLLPPELERVVWQLGPGERSPVVPSDFGFHIVEMIEQDPARPLSLDQLQALQQAAWERWLEQARAEARIERWQRP